MINQPIVFEYSEDLCSFRASLENVVINKKDCSVSLKFDTGAKRTVISIYALRDRWSLNQIKAIKDEFKKNNVKEEEFKSASGHKLYGYPCIAKNVKFDNIDFKEFYFFLVLDTDRKIALLGDDFISSSVFYHDEGGDIYVASINTESYKNKFFNDVLSEGCVLNELVFKSDDENDDIQAKKAEWFRRKYNL